MITTNKIWLYVLFVLTLLPATSVSDEIQQKDLYKFQFARHDMNLGNALFANTLHTANKFMQMFWR